MRDTSIPSGHLAHVCHACHNAKCSNPNHLYWGTPSENAKDRMANGDKTIWQNMVEKYGEEKARQVQRNNGNQSLAGKGNKGKPKSEEHRKKLSESIKKKHLEKTPLW